MALKQAGKKAIQTFVDEGTSFNLGNLTGTNDPNKSGRLPEPFRSQLALLVENDLIARVLYSYATPIAWRTVSGQWIVPEVRYSTSTTNHQNVTRVAVENPGFYKAGA